jgi:hypothetical protein
MAVIAAGDQRFYERKIFKKVSLGDLSKSFRMMAADK